MLTGLWLQACAAARRDEMVAARCRSLIFGVLEAEQLADATPDRLAQTLADGALVVMLQALAVDLTGGTRAAVESAGACRWRPSSCG